MFVHFLTESSFVLTHFFLVVANYYLFEKKIMHPCVLFSLLWFIIISLHIFFRLTFLDQLYPLSNELHLILISGVLFFSFGGWAMSLTANNKSYPATDGGSNANDINLVLRI